MELSTAKTGWERGRHKLKVLLFEDKSYEEYDRQLKKGSLCDSRCNLANLEHEVVYRTRKQRTRRKGTSFLKIQNREMPTEWLDSGNVSWVHPENHMVDEEAIRKAAQNKKKKPPSPRGWGN